jgi:hypothetical protein
MAEASVIVIAAALYVKLIMAVSCSTAKKRKSKRNTCGEDEDATLQLHKKLSLRAKYWQLSELFSLNISNTYSLQAKHRIQRIKSFASHCVSAQAVSK